MKIFDYLAQIPPYVKKQDWDGLVHYFHSLARSLAGELEARRIAAVSFFEYERELGRCLDLALREGSRDGAEAIYFEYDLDNKWQSAFFLCLSYKPEEFANDDWACNYNEFVTGPSFPELASIYRQHGFDKTDEAIGVTLDLVSRTVASFGRVAARIDRFDKPICMAFHDQDPILRIRDAGFTADVGNGDARVNPS